MNFQAKVTIKHTVLLYTPYIHSSGTTYVQYLNLTKKTLTLLAKSEKAKALEAVANDFNTFFLTITESLNSHQMGNENAFSFLKAAFPINFPSIKIIPTNEAEIKNIIGAMKPKQFIRF
jgi:hypothetical protein